MSTFEPRRAAMTWCRLDSRLAAAAGRKVNTTGVAVAFTLTGQWNLMEFKRIFEAQHGLAAATPIFLDTALLLIDCATKFLSIRDA